MKLYKSYINVVFLFNYLKMQHYINSLILNISFIWINTNFIKFFGSENFYSRNVCVWLNEII